MSRRSSSSFAENRGTNPHHRGALFDRDPEIIAHPHREFRQRKAELGGEFVAQFAKGNKVSARMLGRRGQMRDRHKTLNLDPIEFYHLFDDLQQLAWGKTEFLTFPGTIPLRPHPVIPS